MSLKNNSKFNFNFFCNPRNSYFIKSINDFNLFHIIMKINEPFTVEKFNTVKLCNIPNDFAEDKIHSKFGYEKLNLNNPLQKTIIKYNNIHYNIIIYVVDY